MPRIVQLSDLHVFRDPDARLFGIPTRELAGDIVAHALAHAGDVDHLIVTGDLTHDEVRESYEAVRALLEPWLDRLWIVPGNHDDRSVLREVFRDRVSGTGSEPVRFSFTTADDWLCLGLDSHIPGEVAGRFDDEQARWLGEQLSSHDLEHVAVFIHHAPVDVGPAWLDRIGLTGREALLRILADDGRAKFVSAGHVHFESRHTIGSIDVMTIPSAGLQIDPHRDEASFVRAAPGYRVIDLDGDTWSTSVVRLPEARYEPEQP